MKWAKHILIFIVIFLLVGMLLPRLGCVPGQQPGAARPADAWVEEIRVPGQHISERSYTVRAEIADTDAARRKGLSGRPGLEPGYGMLYVYPEPARPELAEAGTPFPLSVAFIRDDGTIADIHQARENDPTRFSPPEPVRYILEVRRGWFEDRGLGKGDRLLLPPEVTGEEAEAAAPAPAGEPAPAETEEPAAPEDEAAAPAP